MPSTRVLVADALPIFRSGVSRLLLREHEFDVVEAASLDDFARYAERWPDIVLLDADLPPRGALAAVAWLSEHCDCHTIVWSLDPTPADILELIRAGAGGYLRKDISPRGLVRSLRGAVRGEAPLSRAEVSRVRMPTLIAVGTKDTVAGSPGELASLIPGAQVLPIPNRDHMLAVGDRVYKTGVLKFLEERP